MLCHMIFQIMSTTLFNLIWKELLCFYKNNDLIKPVQICPNHGTMFKDKFVSADTDQSPQIHLDLEQTVTEYYSFPSSKVLNGQEKKDDLLTL
jgi:hypothetical protein